MAQQMVNGSHYSLSGSEIITFPMSKRYAVVSAPECGLHFQEKPNKHGKTQPHISINEYAQGLVDLPRNKFAR